MVNLPAAATLAGRHHVDTISAQTAEATATVSRTPVTRMVALRCISDAVAELLESLDDRVAAERVEAIDRPHTDAGAIRKANDVHRHHSALIRSTTWIRRALQAGDIGDAQAHAELVADAAARVAAGLDALHQILGLGCGHSCPAVTTAPGDLERFSAGLLDRLAGEGLAVIPAGDGPDRGRV
jgi:hypothetical protein